MRILVAVSFLALASAAVCEPAMALRDAAHGTVTTIERIRNCRRVWRARPEPNGQNCHVGFCQLHWGVLS